MLKYFLIALVVLSLVALVGCVANTPVVGEKKTYNIESDIQSLDIKINAADFSVEQGEKLVVESNLKNLSVVEQDGVLKVVDKTRHTINYSNAMFKLTVPEGKLFENVTIHTGAGKLAADSISANTIELKTGAGQVSFDSLEALDNIDVKGGAGEISVKNGTLNNLTLELGVGELDMTAKLLGESNLKFGVGESDLKLIGSKNDYSFDITSGVGKITVDGENSGFYSNGGNSENLVKIKGGVGATNIEFAESAQ